MKTLALFNNKGGVGKTSLAYHLGFMFAELGQRVLLADLDPQSNLSSMCLTESRLEELWQRAPRPTLHGGLDRLRRGLGDVEAPSPDDVADRVALLVGDLRLSQFEDDLSQQWPRCLDRDERAFRVTTALHRLVQGAGEQRQASVGLLDVGPNFGAINRAALIAADFVVVPVAPDLFSVEGLKNVGPQLKAWREGWAERRERAPALDFALPVGSMTPLGYVVGRHTVFAGGPVRSFERWLDRFPAAYREAFELPGAVAVPFASDQHCLATLKDFRSLMPMAQEAKKPMFQLKPADGAIGGHQAAVRDAHDSFRALAGRLLSAMGLPPPPPFGGPPATAR